MAAKNSTPTEPLFTRPQRIGAALGVLAVLGLVGKQLWNGAQAHIRSSAHYRVTAAEIDLPPAPPWIHVDLRKQALAAAQLENNLSVLDPPELLQRRVADAFAFQPWVRRVLSVEKTPPNRLRIALEYRQPAAAIAPREAAQNLLVLDQDGVRLPEADLTPAECQYLPRVLDIEGSPLVGERWNDPRVTGALTLIRQFGPQWRTLELVDAIPSTAPEVRGELRYFTYDLVTSGGSTIHWGTAPGYEPVTESNFATKLQRLQQYIAKNGALESFTSPVEIDVRDGLSTEPRTVKRDADDAVK